MDIGEKKLNVLMVISWYGLKDGSAQGGSFHYEQVKSLNDYCNCAIFLSIRPKSERAVLRGRRTWDIDLS